MTHRECQDRFVEALYGELDESLRNDVEAHLQSCLACRRAFREFEFVTATMNRRQRPEMSEADWKIFWNELSVQLEKDGEPGRISSAWDSLIAFFRFRPFIRYGLAGAFLVAVGVLIGQFTSGSMDFDADRLAGQLSEGERTILNERAQNYLQRSKVLLLGIVNNTSVSPISYDLPKQQEISRILVKEGGELRGALTEADQQRMRKLVADLELILLQIANLEVKQDYPALEVVRNGVQNNGLLLKINLEQMRSQGKKEAPAEQKQQSQNSI